MTVKRGLSPHPLLNKDKSRDFEPHMADLRVRRVAMGLAVLKCEPFIKVYVERRNFRWVLQWKRELGRLLIPTSNGEWHLLSPVVRSFSRTHSWFWSNYIYSIYKFCVSSLLLFMVWIPIFLLSYLHLFLTLYLLNIEFVYSCLKLWYKEMKLDIKYKIIIYHIQNNDIEVNNIEIYI